MFSYSENIDLHNLDEIISGFVWYLKYYSTFAVMTTIYFSQMFRAFGKEVTEKHKINNIDKRIEEDF
jgi:hypothetical protein